MIDFCVVGVYCSGWAKRGPVGVIAGTMTDAFETADSVIEDIESGVIKPSTSCIKDITESLLHEGTSNILVQMVFILIVQLSILIILQPNYFSLFYYLINANCSTA